MRSSRDRSVHNLHTEQMDAVWQFWAAGLISSAPVPFGARLCLLDLKVPRPVAKSANFVNQGRNWGKGPNAQFIIGLMCAVEINVFVLTLGLIKKFLIEDLDL